MRKFLMASAAILGATVAVQGSAYAQAPTPAPMPVGPPPMGTLVVPNFGKSANDNNNYQAAAIPGAVANPTPGSMVIRLNGKLWTEFGVGGGTGYVNGSQKENADGMGAYFRLYPGVDGMATNGLRWGAQAEIRENFSGNKGVAVNGQAVNSTSVSAGVTAINALNSQTNCCSSLTCAQTLYVRRAFTWVAMDNIGIFRFGLTDGVAGIFDNGITTFQNVGQGLWNGDAPAWVSGNAQPQFPWYSQQGAEYGSVKMVYLSPQFFGIDIGLDFAPNNGNLENGCSAAGQGCPQLTSSAQVNNSVSVTPTDNFRWTNRTDIGARYQGVFGPVAAYAFGDWIHTGVVDYTGPVPAGLPAGSKYTGKMNGVDIGFGGAAITIAGFQFGGSIQGGRQNGVANPAPQGGASGVAWLMGFAYTNGPWTVGAQYYEYDCQGAVALTGISQQHNDAFGVGGNYQVTPGLQAYAEYVYGQVHQGDYNFLSGSPGSTLHNDAHGQALIVGLEVGW